MQGKLKNRPLSFDITTECACCHQPLHIAMDHELTYQVAESDASPLVLMPLVNLLDPRTPSIVDDF